MSLKPQPIPPVPPETARIARAAFPKGNIYRQLRERVGTISQDENFVALLAKEGAPGLPPWRLALVTILQFHEHLSDRQATEAVRARIDWKYVLSLDLTDPGFDFSVLSEFRARNMKRSTPRGQPMPQRPGSSGMPGARGLKGLSHKVCVPLGYGAVDIGDYQRPTCNR